MRPLPALLLGVTLGSAATWTFRQLAPPSPLLAHPPSPDLAADSVSEAASPTTMNRPSSIINTRLAGPEADAALDAYLALPPLSADASRAEITARSARLRALLTLLPTPSFTPLFAALATRAGPPEAELRRLAFEIWTENDAPAAARWALALVPGEAINAPARARYATQAVRAWSRLDFDAAYAWSSTLPDSDLARATSGDLLARLATTDPTRALALARAGGEEFLAATQRGIFNAWAEKSPSAALLALGGSLLADNQTRWSVTTALSRWALSDPAAALGWLDGQGNLDAANHGNMVWSLVHQVSRNETSAHIRPFADALAARAQTGQGHAQLANLLSGWAERDTSAALAWLDSIPDLALRNDLITRAIDNRSSENPAADLPLALRLPPGLERDNALATVLGQWAETDPDAALGWLREHDDPSLTGVAARVQGRLLGKLAATDPAAALARWQSLPADESRIAAVPGTAKAWARTDPAAATRWISAQLPELPDMRPADFEKLSPQAQVELQQKFMAYGGHFDALQEITTTWFQKDPAAMVAWADGLSIPLLKEGILDSLGQGAGSVYGDDVPDRADHAARIATITDPILRDRILGAHLEAWLRADLRAAREWIDTHDALSAEKAAEILTRAQANAE